MHKGDFYERLSKMSTSGAAPGVPLIEMVADKRVLIENHKGIYRYSREQICVCTVLGMIRIDGCRLFIEKMSNEQLTITGVIHNVSLCRGAKNAK